MKANKSAIYKLLAIVAIIYSGLVAGLMTAVTMFWTPETKVQWILLSAGIALATFIIFTLFVVQLLKKVMGQMGMGQMGNMGGFNNFK